MIAKYQYGPSTALTMTLASLASSTTVGWASAAVDNSADAYLDILIQIRFKLVAGTPAGDQDVYVYAYGSEDGTDFPDGITGTSGSYTFRAPTNLILLYATAIAAAGQLVCPSNPLSLALAFNGLVPRKWGIVIRNYTGLAFSATESDHAARYTGIYIQNV
jgi:hypothetical protein